jgi:hypothetical protein
MGKILIFLLFLNPHFCFYNKHLALLYHMFGMLLPMLLIMINPVLMRQDMFGTESNSIFIHNPGVNINTILHSQIDFLLFKQ